MTKVTTALVLIGPSGVGPFHSPGWRVRDVLQLVEGGHAGPFWRHDRLGEREGDGQSRVRFVESVDHREVARTLLEELQAVVGCSEAELSDRCRIGVVHLDLPTLLDGSSLAELRDAGLPVEVYAMTNVHPRMVS